MFLVILAKKRMFSDIGDTLLSEFAYYERRTSFGLGVIKLPKKPFVRTSYRLYLGLQPRSIEIN